MVKNKKNNKNSIFYTIVYTTRPGVHVCNKFYTVHDDCVKDIELLCDIQKKNGVTIPHDYFTICWYSVERVYMEKMTYIDPDKRKKALDSIKNQFERVQKDEKVQKERLQQKIAQKAKDYK